MITDSFDNFSEAIINPVKNSNKIDCDICIVTFSNAIENFVINNFDVKKVSEFSCSNGRFPIYLFRYKNKNIGFYKTIVGASISVGILEEVSVMLNVRKFVVFGSAGVLDKEICYNKVVVPNQAYRDEGTSYHYCKAQDYIEIKNCGIVEEFLVKNNIPCVLGKCWTTDAFYRETKNNFLKRKNDGCIVVDMECSAMQSVCDFRGYDLYYFLLSGDLLDAPVWDDRKLNNANHDIENFAIALNLSLYVLEK